MYKVLHRSRLLKKIETARLDEFQFDREVTDLFIDFHPTSFRCDSVIDAYPSLAFVSVPPVTYSSPRYLQRSHFTVVDKTKCQRTETGRTGHVGQVIPDPVDCVL